MGKKAQEIVGLNLKELIQDLNRAYCDEWLAFYSYWYLAKTVSGKGYEDMQEFLEETAKDELEHAAELAERIIQLGGLPTNSPTELEKNANDPYPGVVKELDDYDKIIDLVTKAEAGAIEVYNKIASKTFGKDHQTYQLICHILGEEIAHEEKFESLKG